MAGEQMPPPEQGGGAPGGADQILQVVDQVDSGLSILNEVVAQLPIDDAAKQQLAQIQTSFQELVMQVMQGGGQPPAQGQAPMEGGPSGVPANPSIRS